MPWRANLDSQVPMQANRYVELHPPSRVRWKSNERDEHVLILTLRLKNPDFFFCEFCALSTHTRKLTAINRTITIELTAIENNSSYLMLKSVQLWPKPWVIPLKLSQSVVVHEVVVCKFFFMSERFRVNKWKVGYDDESTRLAAIWYIASAFDSNSTLQTLNM